MLPTLAAIAAAPPLTAQQRLVGTRSLTLSPTYQSWSFPDGVVQPTTTSGETVRVDRVSQWSVPIAAIVPLGEQWTVDAAWAYASSTVTLAAPDATLGTDRYTLSGVSDVRLRAVGQLVRDKVLVTLGVNAPSGMTSLDPEQLAALRVLAAPALAFQIPAPGSGPGGTAGVVLARELAGWGWALGLSYEVRGTYAPVAALVAGSPSPDFDPGDALHVSLGTDGLVGAHAMTLGVTADFYGDDELTAQAGTGAAASSRVRLGPTWTAEWQLRLAVPRFRELALFAVDRQRAKYERDGVSVAGSSGNYLDAGIRGVLGLDRVTGLVVGLDARHHTGLKVDNTLATAGMTSLGATLGLAREVGGGAYTLQPYVRLQTGRLDTGGAKADARGLMAGLTLAARR